MTKKQLEGWSPWILLTVVLGLWQLICTVFNVSEFIFPSPWRIAKQFWEFKEIIGAHAWRTYWVTMAGFGIAIVVGVLLGFVIGSSRLAYAAVYPLMTAFNALPKAAFVPILVVWFGIGAGPAILTAFLISFFPIMVNIATGLATLEPELEDVLRVLGAKRWDVLIKVGLPRSRCRHCGHPLRWIENIPVLSFLALRGRCAACGAGISWRYPAVEALTGLLFAYCAARWGIGPEAAVWAAYGSILLA
ncbi:MAG: ABC transporter permease subunit, partial [Betaproteobacteria bacterium]|nr:ABC transporter permease subunit [Betaproteobacteria bacterium]